MESSLQQAWQNSFPFETDETTIYSSENYFALWAGVTDVRLPTPLPRDSQCPGGGLHCNFLFRVNTDRHGARTSRSTEAVSESALADRDMPEDVEMVDISVIPLMSLWRQRTTQQWTETSTVAGGGPGTQSLSVRPQSAEDKMSHETSRL